MEATNETKEQQPQETGKEISESISLDLNRDTDLKQQNEGDSLLLMHHNDGRLEDEDEDLTISV